MYLSEKWLKYKYEIKMFNAHKSKNVQIAFINKAIQYKKVT